MDPLAQLNDIVEISQVSWWPLSWGWWLLLVVLLALISTAFMRYRQARQHRAYLRSSQQALLHCTTVAEISRLLKQVVLHYYPQHNPFSPQVEPSQSLENLTGRAWLDFLNQQLTVQHQQSTTYLDNISQLMYSQHHARAFQPYLAFAQLWLNQAPFLNNKRGLDHV